MGEITDQIIDRFIFGPPSRTKSKPRTWQAGSGQRCWRTATGEVVAMETMTDAHLRNALRMCERNGNPGKAKDIRAVLYERSIRKPSTERSFANDHN